MLNFPATYAIPVTPSDTVQLPGKASFFYVSNAGAATESVTIRTAFPVVSALGQKNFDVTWAIPAGAMLPLYVQGDYVLATGIGADITVVACYNS